MDIILPPYEDIDDNGKYIGKNPLFFNIKKGDKIYFKYEKRPYTVKSCDKKWVICTKPFNLQKTVFYTILNLEENIRGTNNLIWNIYDYKIQEDIDECLKDLQSGETEITRRNRVHLDIVKHIKY
jgi:hypothetical protein